MRQLKIQKSITNRSSEALDKYLVEIGRAPLISIDEEIELAQIIKKGGPQAERAKDRLVTANLRFVVSVAKQYQHQGLTLTDLIDEGNIGLIKAAQKFDETRGFKFISYAVWWIRQSILQAIAEQSRIVRLPLNQVGSLNKINHEISKFEQEHQRRPSIAELSEATNIDQEKIGQSMMADGHHVSIDAPFQDGEENCMLDVMPSGEDCRTDRMVDHESMALELNNVLNEVLKEREVIIIRECFGIGCHEKGLEEIGDQLGLTRERVRQIREKYCKTPRKWQCENPYEVSRLIIRFGLFIPYYIYRCRVKYMRHLYFLYSLLFFAHKKFAFYKLLLTFADKEKY